jgi:hypothetical protein
MNRRAGRLVVATAVALLLLGLGATARAVAAVDTAAAPTATAVGHDPVVVAFVGATRLPAAEAGSRGAALAATDPARWVPTAAGARSTTDGATRTPAPHLLASTGDRAPPPLL